MIKSVEIICKPCDKCEALEQKIRNAIKVIEIKNRIKIKYDLKRNKDMFAAEKYGYGTKDLPLTLINDHVVFDGHVKGEDFIRFSLEAINREY
jgi:hypothetical protein